MNRRHSTAATSDRFRCMPSSGSPYRFGHSRRTDHAVAMSVEKHSFVRAGGGVPLAPRQPLSRQSFSTNGLDSTSAARGGEPPDRHVGCPALDHLIAAQNANALTVDEADIMDLTTLVTACALAVDPKIMHALISHQSGGEPWSFTVGGVRQPPVFRDLSDAVDAAHTTYPADVAIRIGLTGLSATPRSVAAAMFAPCSNITIAARQIAQLAEHCKTSSHVSGDPMYCAIAAYHGSWERPDNVYLAAATTARSAPACWWDGRRAARGHRLRSSLA